MLVVLPVTHLLIKNEKSFPITQDTFSPVRSMGLLDGFFSLVIRTGGFLRLVFYTSHEDAVTVLDLKIPIRKVLSNTSAIGSLVKEDPPLRFSCRFFAEKSN